MSVSRIRIEVNGKPLVPPLRGFPLFVTEEQEKDALGGYLKARLFEPPLLASTCCMIGCTVRSAVESEEEVNVSEEKMMMIMMVFLVDMVTNQIVKQTTTIARGEAEAAVALELDGAEKAKVKGHDYQIFFAPVKSYEARPITYVKDAE